MFQAKECQNHLESAILPKLPVEILLGKKNLEVRPTSINKVNFSFKSESFDKINIEIKQFFI